MLLRSSASEDYANLKDLHMIKHMDVADLQIKYRTSGQGNYITCKRSTVLYYHCQLCKVNLKLF